MLRNFESEPPKQGDGRHIIFSNNKPNTRKRKILEAKSEEKIKSFCSQAMAPKSGIADNDANFRRIRFKITKATTPDGTL